MARPFHDRVLEAHINDQVLLKAWRKQINGTTSLGRHYHTFQESFDPAAGTYPGAALSRQQITGGNTPTVTGGYITFLDPTAPDQNFLTFSHNRGENTASDGTLFLFDMLVSYQGFDANSAASQVVTGGAGAGNTDLPRHDGRNVFMFLDTQTALGGTAATIDVTYTNRAGTSARTTQTTSMIQLAFQSELAHLGMALPLQAGDDGVISVQSLQLSAAMGAGTFAVVLGKLIAVLDFNDGADTTAHDLVFREIRARRLLTGAAISSIYRTNAGTADPIISGELQVTFFDPAAT